MQKISKIQAREVLDSRGKPTLETTVWSGKVFATASVPSGASTGVHEALELRDGDKQRFGGQGVLKACKNVNVKLAKALLGMSPFSQEQLDQRMLDIDGTKQKALLGANAMLSVSLAVARLSAELQKKELFEYLAKLYGYKSKIIPTPLFNVINGGVHADSGLDIQEFFIIPQKGNFETKLRMGAEVYQVLKALLAKGNFTTSVGDEGGFAPRLGENSNAFIVLEQAIKEAGYRIGKDFLLGIDAASSEFYDSIQKLYKIDGKRLTYTQVIKLYKDWVDKYKLQIIEDGFAEDDMEGWQTLTRVLGKKTILIGDDLFVTDSTRLEAGVSAGMANAVLVKVNQIGTLTETIKTVKLAQSHKYKVIVSHRSGETNDDFIADLAVAINADYAKMGSVSRGERLAKYNRLMKIEQILRVTK